MISMDHIIFLGYIFFYLFKQTYSPYFIYCLKIHMLHSTYEIWRNQCYLLLSLFSPNYHFYHFQFILIIFPRVLLHIIYCVLTVLSPFCCFSDGFHFLWFFLTSFMSSARLCFISLCCLTAIFFFWVLVIFLWNLWLIHLVILNSWQYAWPRFLSAWWQYFFYLLCFWPAICFFCSFFPKSIFKWFCLYPLENYYHTILIEVANHVCVSYLHKAYVGKCLSNIRIGSD